MSKFTKSKRIFYHHNTIVIFNILFLSVNGLLGYPIDKLNIEKSPELDETRYSNGTVVGKYIYMDDEGNPIHVKYYADNASYG